MSIAYLQCDLRFNKYLLEKVAGMYVIEHTIQNIKKIGCKEIIAGVYDCKENAELIEVMNLQGIRIVKSNDNNVNTRFINIIINENADYVIRIGGDQVLLDAERIMKILKTMKEQNKEFFYEPSIASVLPDIVSVNCLKKHKESVLDQERYFEALIKEETVERYKMKDSGPVLFDFRINSNEGLRVCKKVIENDLNVYDLSKKLAVKLNYRTNYLNMSGLWGSWILADECEDFFFDEDGKVNPWMGRSVIDFISKRLRNDFKVFEWGSGNSTLFWSQYVAEVVSVEHNLEWYEKVKKIIPDNVRLQYCELVYDGEYCRRILNEKELFDIVVIDGRDRVNCAKKCLSKLKENGIILWDNSEREEYVEGYKFLKEHGFSQLEMSSIVYGLPGIEEFTSIFYRDNNILNI